LPGRKLTALVSGICLLGLLTPLGCIGIDQAPDDKKTHKAAKPKVLPAGDPQVKLDSNGRVLSEVDETALSPADFVQRINRLLATDRPSDATRWVERYPDVALETLRSAEATAGSSAVLVEIARIYDRQCGLAADAGWEAALRDRAQRPGTYAAHDVARKQLAEKIKSGKTTDVNPSAVVDSLPRKAPLMLEVDAWHLAGTALMLQGKSDEAVPALQRALERGQAAPHQAAYLLLTISDAQRRGGHAIPADASWQAAVTRAGELLGRPRPVADPTLWDRAAYLRPVQLPWPAPVQHQIRVCIDGPAALPAGAVTAAPRRLPDGSSLEGESLVWTCIGRSRLERNEPQLAIVALKRGEAWALDPNQKDRLQLDQAEALLQLKQVPAATAMLVGLTHRPPPIACAAHALLGASKLQAGSPSQGLTLLKRAVEEHETLDWPGRADAEANLGLAYLMTGDDQAGLQRLHAAQRRFEATKDVEKLRQSLENEAAYLEKLEKKEAAAEVWQRLQALGNPEVGRSP